MTFFGEKSSQLEMGHNKAFGISISSRYAKASEMVEMILFAKMIAEFGLHHLVESVFYDSQSQCCNIELKADVGIYSAVAEQIRLCAAATITQYEWAGAVEN